jgi:hypothetical protein
VKLKLMSGCLAVAFVVQITASDAQSVSPAGHYTKKRGGAGEMWVQKAGAEWRIFVNAGGIPRAGATAADCALIVVGTIERNTFQGEVKYELDASELDQARRKAVLDYLKGAQALLQRPQHRRGYICRDTLFILGHDDLALERDMVRAIGDEPISLG